MYLTGLGMGHSWTGILLIRFLKTASDSKSLRPSLLPEEVFPRGLQVCIFPQTIGTLPSLVLLPPSFMVLLIVPSNTHIQFSLTFL